MHKVIIIGAGPAGATCALYLKQAGINPLVFNDFKSSLNNATIRNLYSYNEIKGIDLFNKGLEQLKEANIDIINETVIDINYTNSFNIVTKNNVYEAEYLVLAIGRSDTIKEPFNNYLGKGVSLCALCDAPLYKNKTIYLTGDFDTINHTKEELNRYSSDVKLINLDDILSLKGETMLEEIITKDKVIKSNNLFLSLKPSPQSLYFKLGLITNDGLVKTDHNFLTSVPNLYSIGDMTNKVKQISTALSSATKCAVSIIKEVKNENN